VNADNVYIKKTECH